MATARSPARATQAIPRKPSARLRRHAAPAPTPEARNARRVQAGVRLMPENQRKAMVLMPEMSKRLRQLICLHIALSSINTM